MCVRGTNPNPNPNPDPDQLDLEEQKRARWKAENVRRKHNYVPFIINLLRCASTRVSRRVQWKGHAAAHETREAGYPCTCSLLPPTLRACLLTLMYLLPTTAQGVRRQAAAAATARGRQGQAEAAHGGGRRQKVKSLKTPRYRTVV